MVGKPSWSQHENRTGRWAEKVELGCSLAVNPPADVKFHSQAGHSTPVPLILRLRQGEGPLFIGYLPHAHRSTDQWELFSKIAEESHHDKQAGSHLLCRAEIVTAE